MFLALIQKWHNVLVLPYMIICVFMLRVLSLPDSPGILYMLSVYKYNKSLSVMVSVTIFC